jgi:hypothetical protein
MSLIGPTELAGNADVVGSQDFLAAVGSILAVALGVLCGTQLEEWIDVGAPRFPRRRSGARASCR